MRRVRSRVVIPAVIAASILTAQGSIAASYMIYTDYKTAIDSRITPRLPHLALTDDTGSTSPRAPLPEPPGGYPGLLYNTYTMGADIFQYVGKSAVNAVTLILSPLIYVGKLLVGSMY